MEAISHYNLGHSATKTLRYLKRRFGISVPENTFRFWYAQHKPICTYHQIRAVIKQKYEPAELIVGRALEHKQVYVYQYHRGKLDYLMRFPSHRAFAPICEYLTATVPGPDFPHELFTSPDRSRSSQYPVILEADTTRKENYATKLAALALQIAPSNKRRHDTLQRFMLANGATRSISKHPQMR